MSARALYYSLFVFLAASVTLFLAFVFGVDGGLWESFYIFYLVSALCHTWYIMLLLAEEYLFPRKYPRYRGETISIVLPCYNEDPALVRQSIRSVVEAFGNKEIILVNDGSTNGIETTLHELERDYGILVHSFPENRGKRAAMHWGMTHATGQFIIMSDSDTVFDRHAFVRIAEALKHGTIGAASGDVQLLNEKENWLTKMTAAYYWTALHINRKAQSALGQVACCSGALAGYRAEILKKVADEFLNETFLGEKCTYSDDRHLTNLVLREGYDVVFVPEAVSYTYSPTTMRGFLKQQIRWRRGFLQEAIYAATFMWKKKPILFVEIVLWELLLPFVSFGLVVLVMLNTVIDPAFTLMVLIPSLLTLAIIRHMPVIFFAPNRLLGLFYFTFFSHFVMYWQTFHALFTLRKRGWSTR